MLFWAGKYRVGKWGVGGVGEHGGPGHGSVRRWGDGRVAGHSCGECRRPDAGMLRSQGVRRAWLGG